MPDRLKAILEKIKEWWLKFTTKQKTLLISITAVVILALVILAVVMTKPTMVQLITCEDATQASSVKDLLDGNSIDYEVSSDGMTFSVNAKNQADANILLGSNSIPTNGFTIDDALSGSISTTEADKSKRYQVFLEDKFAKELENMDLIKSADVNLNIPEDDGTLVTRNQESYASVLTEILDSNILVISKKGKVLGSSQCRGIDEIHELIVDEVGGFIDSMLNERLLGILSTKENVNLETLGFESDIKKYSAIITPIDIAGERLGTLFVYRYDNQYDIDDIILSEYGTTVVGLEMMRSVNEENAEETRKVQIVRSAISTLSFSELEAITHIFDELNGTEGILVASKIADRVGITRSVIVNALRKFESAGVIESRSSGMKGTYIKVLNEVIFDELEEIKAQRSKKA